MSIQVGRANGKGTICAEELVKVQIEKLKELSKKFKGTRCSQYCSVWNSEDKDCEIMGDYHLSPSRCRHFLMQELRSEEKQE
jgi:hypothetical protein